MPVVSTEKMLLDAQKGGYAVGAFNAENMEMAQAIIAAAEESGMPLIVQITTSTLKYTGVDCFAGMVSGIAKRSRADIAIHLDHGRDLALAAQALRAGFSSVMIDGSMLPYEDNITVCTRVVSMCEPNGVPVEAELGAIGGKEDDVHGSGAQYTDPAQAADFVERTGISSLAVAIGTAHGFYSGTPVLDTQRLAKIREKVSIPLVLHGASGLSAQQVQECIKEGICKVNFATELRAAYTKAVRKCLEENADVYDPKDYGKLARECVKAQVLSRIAVCAMRQSV